MYLRSDVGQTLLRSIVSGATIPLIQLKALQELKVVVPAAAEAKKIIDTFHAQVERQKQIQSLREEQLQLDKVHWSLNER